MVKTQTSIGSTFHLLLLLLAMLTKFSCFLLLFTFIFLLISYLFELVLELWLSQQSNSTSKTATSASPFDFGVDQLKLILSFRGIYYLQQQQHQQLSEKSLNVQQRKEKLAELVATSGQINHEELLQLRLESSTTTKTDESRPSPTAAGRSASLKVFASAKLMEEEIDDSHIWLLYISPNEDNEQEVVALPNVWSTLVRQFGKFDLRFARFDCKADPLYCHRRGWQRSPRLVLVFPRSRNEVGRRIYHYPLGKLIAAAVDDDIYKHGMLNFSCKQSRKRTPPMSSSGYRRSSPVSSPLSTTLTLCLNEVLASIIILNVVVVVV